MKFRNGFVSNSSSSSFVIYSKTGKEPTLENLIEWCGNIRDAKKVWARIYAVCHNHEEYIDLVLREESGWDEDDIKNYLENIKNGKRQPHYDFDKYKVIAFSEDIDNNDMITWDSVPNEDNEDFHLENEC